ncbi:uncharacterized protein LOC126147227 isoform X1 [Schistocerca cancellata]|uniref:uncharacterized protein LOC126147227 isoform X1 n=2 Tax=Schistocerca cancellata TaxID=274614 RepID=UPI002118E3C5|nr:uncharacterized protein LOC126147227 isoform X1 [Schistocerca cancellata]
MEKEFDKINMSLDDIIRTSRLCHPKLHGSRKCTQDERGRSRSRSRNACRGQQWRLERGRQQHLTDNLPPRSRSRSQASYRSNSPVPSLLSVPVVPPRGRSRPRQNYSFCSQKPTFVQRMGWRNGLGVNIRKHRLGFSASSTSVRRPTTSLQLLQLAKKRVQIAKNILNARHQSYLKQLQQYRREVLEDSFQMPHYRVENMQEFPALFSEIGDCNRISHNRIGRQRVHTKNYSEGTLSVTFENELANSQTRTRTVENGSIPLGFKPSEALTVPPQTMVNGYIIRNPSLGKVTNDDGVYVSNENVRQTGTNDSLPVLVSSSDFPQLIHRHNECNMDKKRIIHPANTVQTLNQRFSNYRVVCL